MYLSVQLQPIADTTMVVALAGELDAMTVPILSETLEPLVASPAMCVVVAAGDLWFCDLRGVSRLVAARRGLRVKGGDLVLAEASPALRRLISLMEQGRRSPLPVFDTLPQALAACGVCAEPAPPGPRHLPLLRGLPARPVTGRRRGTTPPPAPDRSPSARRRCASGPGP